jgi:hypothetical protein
MEHIGMTEGLEVTGKVFGSGADIVSGHAANRPASSRALVWPHPVAKQQHPVVKEKRRP